MDIITETAEDTGSATQMASAPIFHTIFPREKRIPTTDLWYSLRILRWFKTTFKNFYIKYR